MNAISDCRNVTYPNCSLISEMECDILGMYMPPPNLIVGS